jgi:hypothetical protein
VSRVCYESWDENIYISDKCKPFTDVFTADPVAVSATQSDAVFQNILKWLTNKHDTFSKGERNHYSFKLASACCRFGIAEDECRYLFQREYPCSTDFTEKELTKTIRSAYRASAHQFGSATFDQENERLIDTQTKREIAIEQEEAQDDIKPKDVIFGEDVKADALHLFRNGYEKLYGIGVPTLDEHFKLKRGEITLLSGIGNYGKSTFILWYLLMRVLKYGEKFAFFCPEINPAHEFYHDLTEMYFGTECVPSQYVDRRPKEAHYSEVYDIISKHVFYVYPKELSPTPSYIKSRFLKLIVKEKVDGCIIDPFNQMTNAYKERSDKYLETFLGDCSRFAQTNNVYFIVVAHPTKLQKDKTDNYPCPDVFDIADGAMWNNKMDNILIYHRPDHQTDPTGSRCVLHTKKIRRQKTVGKKGVVNFEYMRSTRRYFFDDKDYLQELIDSTNNTPEHDQGLPF